VRVEPAPGDEALLIDKEPTPMDWLGRQLAVVTTLKMRVNAANVFGDYLMIVPEQTGFLPLKDAKLEAALEEFLGALVKTLAVIGFDAVIAG